MNLSAIGANLGFKGSLPELPPDMEWACDNGVDGPYPRKKSKLERQPEQDGFTKSCCCDKCSGEDERHYSYTADNRRETWEG